MLVLLGKKIHMPLSRTLLHIMASTYLIYYKIKLTVAKGKRKTSCL